MTRPVLTKVPPRRSKCKACGAAVWRVTIGSWGQSILFDREGSKPLRGGEQKHRCAGKES